MLRPRLNQRIWLRLSSVFESRRISFLKIFLVVYMVATHQAIQENKPTREQTIKVVAGGKIDKTISTNIKYFLEKKSRLKVPKIPRLRCLF